MSNSIDYPLDELQSKQVIVQCEKCGNKMRIAQHKWLPFDYNDYISRKQVEEAIGKNDDTVVQDFHLKRWAAHRNQFRSELRKKLGL